MSSLVKIRRSYGCTL